MPTGQYAVADAKPVGAYALADAKPVPDFAATNQKDPQGNATVDWLDRLVQWLPAAAGATGGVMGSAGGPPGAIMGAALGGAAGEAYKQLIRRARGVGDVPSTSMDAAKNIGAEGAIQGAAQGVGEAIAPVLRTVGSRMMQSAVKPGLKMLLRDVKQGADVPRVVKTLLDEGVSVTPTGLAKLQTLLKSTNDEIATALASSSGTVSPIRVASRLNQTARTFASQVNPQADLEAISTVGENFLGHPGLTGASISLPEAQALKTGTYARIGEKYGQASAAGIEAEKALARGLKEEIASEVPAVTELNAKEGRLLEALHTVGKRVALAGNKDPIGFAWVAHNPMTFLAALMDRSPAVKSMVARGLYQSAGAAAQVAPQLIRLAVGAIAQDGSGAPAASPPRE